MILGKSSLDIIWFSNSIGFIRFLGVYVLLSYALPKLEVYSTLYISFFLISPLAGIIDYFNIEPFNSVLNSIYRADPDNDIPGRALGIFQRVHGLAYFSTFAVLLLSNYPKLIENEKIRISAIVLNFIALILTFSRSALLALFISLVYSYKAYFIRYITFISLSISLILFFAEGSKVFRIIDSIYQGFRFLAGFSYNYDQAAFIVARLDWGWGNAINQFYTSPVFGSLDRSGTFFVGDGGYVELLANQGLMGIIGFLLFFFVFFRSKLPVISTLGVFFLIANIGSSSITERLLEITLITVFFLYIHEQKDYSINR